MTQRIGIESEDLKEAHIAPFTILRVACLPTDVLKAFVAPELSLDLEDYIKARNQLRESCKELVNTLERLVPNADTNEFRHRLIQLKRDIHNNRSFILEDEIREWLAANTSCAVVQNWQKLQQQTKDALQRLKQEANRAFDIIDTVLAQCWDNPIFRQGVSTASPSFSNQVSPDWRSFRQKKKKGISRSLFAYVTRAAAKTSPFSTLTSNCILPLGTFNGRSHLVAKRVEILATSTLNHSIATVLRNALLARYANQLPIFFHLSPHVRISGNKISGLTHQYKLRRGILWLDQYPIVAHLAPDIAEIFQQLPDVFQWSQLLESLRKLGLEDVVATQTVNELLKKDIIRSPLEWSSDCNNPAMFLVEKLKNCQSDMLEKFRNSLLSTDKITRSFSTNSTMNRAKAIQQIHSLYTELYAKLSHYPPPEIHTAVYENAWIRGIDFKAGSGFAKLFQRLGKAINDKICVSRTYIWLRDKFIEEYGEGGICDNVPLFIMAAWRKITELVPDRNNNLEPKSIKGKRDRFAGVAMNHVSVPLTFFVQVVGRCLGDLEAAEPQIVLNLGYNRIGWQTARLCNHSYKSVGSLQNQIRHWLKDAFAPKIPVSITVSSESSTLQAHACCTDQTLAVDGVVGVDDLKLSDLMLKHNRKTNLLEITTRNNIAIQTNYLGGLVPVPGWGPRYLAILMGEPFELIRPSPNRLWNANDLQTIRHQKRIEEYGCVLVRETWWVRSSELFRWLNWKSLADRLIAAQDFRDEHKIPRYVYAKGQVTSWTMDNFAKVKKPIWLDFQNAACLDSILTMAKEVDWVILMEALPSQGQNVLKVRGCEYVSEFIFEAVFSGASKNQH